MRLDNMGHCTEGHRLPQCIKATCSLETRSFWASTSDASGQAILLQELPSLSCQRPALLGTLPKSSSLYQHKCSLLAVQSPSLCLLQGLNNSVSDTKAPVELRSCCGRGMLWRADAL